MSCIQRYCGPFIKKAILTLRSKHTLPNPSITTCTLKPTIQTLEKKWSQTETDLIYSIELPPEAKVKRGRKSVTRDALRAKLAADLLPGRSYLAIFLKICLDRRKSKKKEETERMKENEEAYKPNRRSFWSSEEKRLFVEAINYFGTDWELVSEHVGTRTRKQCQNNYHMHSKNPEYYQPGHEANRATWKREEVKKLIGVIEKHGEDWDVIAASFPTRSLASLKKKYFVLTLEEGTKRFSPGDDKKLAELLVNVKLPNWETVSKLLDGNFTPKECQLRWNQIRSTYK